MDDATLVGTKCRNCDAPLAPTDAYCPRCGQKVAAHRLTLHEISHDLMHALFHVDRSVLSLLRLLLTQPGCVARDFVEGKRKRYFGPFALLVIVVALASAAVHLSGTQKLVLVPEGPAAMAEYVQEFLISTPIWCTSSRCRCWRPRAAHSVSMAASITPNTWSSRRNTSKTVRILFFTLAILPLKFAAAGASATVVQLYVAYLTLWALYFGIAMAQFSGEHRLLAAIKGIVAVILAQGSGLPHPIDPCSSPDPTALLLQRRGGGPMTTYVALLRAVNVGGTGKLAMADLKSLCVKAGFDKVQTYIASGNIVLREQGAGRRREVGAGIPAARPRQEAH